MLSFEVIWQDDDMVEIDAYVSNGQFIGRTQVYTTYEELRSLAQSLRGFPESTAHELQFEAGNKNSYSYFGVRFYCFDATGHAALQAVVESNVASNDRAEEKSKLQLEVQVEPSQVDLFSAQLLSVVNAKAGGARLVGIGAYSRNVADAV
jgi:hypothetical protein